MIIFCNFIFSGILCRPLSSSYPLNWYLVCHRRPRECSIRNEYEERSAKCKWCEQGRQANSDRNQNFPVIWSPEDRTWLGPYCELPPKIININVINLKLSKIQSLQLWALKRSNSRISSLVWSVMLGSVWLLFLLLFFFVKHLGDICSTEAQHK